MTNSHLNITNGQLLWKQTDFITATGYAKAITELSNQPNLSLTALLLGTYVASHNDQLETPIEALTQQQTFLQNTLRELGLSKAKTITPITDKSIPMDEELKLLLQDYRNNTLECLINDSIAKIEIPQDTQYPATEKTLLILKGQRIALSDICPKFFQINLQIIGLHQAIDFACFGVDAQQKLSDEAYMTFFNQPKTPCGGVELVHADTFTANFNCDLNKLPHSIDRLVFIATIDGTETIGQIQNGYLRFIAFGKENAKFTFTSNDFNQEKALILGELYRKDGAWRFNAIAQGFEGGMGALVNHFGGEIAVDTTTAPQSKSNTEVLNEFLLTEYNVEGLFEDQEFNDGTLSSQRIGINIDNDNWIFKVSYTPSINTNNAVITLNYKLKHAFKINSGQELYITSIGAIMNNKLRIGGFWIDEVTGDFSYNAGFFVPPKGITVESMEENHNYCLAVLEEYSPIMKRFVLSTTEDDIVGDYGGALKELGALG